MWYQVGIDTVSHYLFCFIHIVGQRNVIKQIPYITI